MIRLSASSVRPLDSFTVQTDRPGTVRVFDARGRCYHKADAAPAEVVASGALGTHVVSLHDPHGAELDRATLTVDARTGLRTRDEQLSRLMHMLETTFARCNRTAPADGDRVYSMGGVTSRSAMFARGWRYFHPRSADIIDLFATYQPDDGMVWDFGIAVAPGMPYHFEWRWGERFSQREADGQLLFARQPVMNDVEHSYIEGLHLAWQATGDDEWMASRLDSALAAMRFSGRDGHFWSETFGLLKRPFCIDLWDYQSVFDAALVDGDGMDARPGVSQYGVFHGDNTGMAWACRKLAEMCRHAGRHADADEADAFADGLQHRLDELAWNGEFYTHHVPEDPTFERDFGVDTDRQVSLSNTYALNRGIDHEKAVAIIRTYQRIRAEMPDGSPAEWFGIYPPFPRGFHIGPWWYTNGGVTISTAGQLALGAFEHGFEDYGADILRRTVERFAPHGQAFVGGLRGNRFDPPERTFRPVDLSGVANADLLCQADQDRPGALDEPGNDFRELPTGRQTFEDVPFDILPPGQNNDRRMLRLAAGGGEGFLESARLVVDGPCRSLYLLHAVAGGGHVAGEIEWVYDDDSRDRRYLHQGTDVLPFWNPSRPAQHRRSRATTIVAWTGRNERFWRVGLTATGLDNPQPDKPVRHVELHASRDAARWLVVAATACDAEAFFQPDDTEPSGVPPRWGASDLTHALVAGLAGIRDEEANLRRVRVAPRWLAAGVDDVEITARYADGGGYVRYRYRREGDTLRLELAGNAETRRVELLLPPGAQPRAARLNGADVPFETRQVEQSAYACLDAPGPAATTIEIDI